MALPGGRTTNDSSNYFAIGVQSAKDTDATTFYFLKHLDGTGFDVTVDQSRERIGGGGREVGLTYRTKVTSDGQFVAYAQPDFAGRVLAMALGYDSVVAGPSQGSGNAYYSTHSLSPGSQLPYVTVEQVYADEGERTTNCQISDCKLEGEAGKPVKVTAQFISGGTPHYTSTLLSPVREAALPLMIPGGSVAITATGNLTNGVGATSLQITKWSLDIKNTLDDSIQTVALNREDVTWLTADYDVDGTLKYINKDFWNAVNYGGGSTVPTGFITSGAFTFYTSTPSSQSLTLLAPYVEFQAVKLNRLDPDGKTMFLDFTASTKSIGSQAVQATVISGASTAYTNSST